MNCARLSALRSNHRAGHALEEEAYRRQFRLHFEFGCQRLQHVWEESGRDQTRFVGALLQLCGNDLGGTATGGETVSRPRSVVETAVKLKLLVDAEQWAIKQAGGNGLLVISGQPGSGKSQLALDLLAQISRQGVRFLFFDLKGELEAAGDDP